MLWGKKKQHRNPVMRVQLPRSGVVSALTAMRGHVADDNVPFAITAAVVGTAQIPGS